MKFICQTWIDKENDWKQWHLWFAWYPIHLGLPDKNQSRECRWLETVERRWVGGYNNPVYEYRDRP